MGGIDIYQIKGKTKYSSSNQTEMMNSHFTPWVFVLQWSFQWLNLYFINKYMHVWLYTKILLNFLCVLRATFQIKPTRNTYLKKCLTLNCTFPSRRRGGSSNWSVMSFQSCGSASDSECNILSSPWRDSANSCFPLLRVRGILIVTGAMRVTFWKPEM